MKKIVIASNNAGKLREIRAILAPFGLDAVSQKEAGFNAEVEETGTTFAENAALKAHASTKPCTVPSLQMTADCW